MCKLFLNYTDNDRWPHFNALKHVKGSHQLQGDFVLLRNDCYATTLHQFPSSHVEVPVIEMLETIFFHA